MENALIQSCKVAIVGESPMSISFKFFDCCGDLVILALHAFELLLHLLPLLFVT